MKLKPESEPYSEKYLFKSEIVHDMICSRLMKFSPIRKKKWQDSTVDPTVFVDFVVWATLHCISTLKRNLNANYILCCSFPQHVQK